MKRIAIVQSNYVPWKGYFDLIRGVDEFILYDAAQYTRGAWHNRNLVKTATGPVWLTIPVITKGKFPQRIEETRVVDAGWTRKHWKTLLQSYSRAPYFREYASQLEPIYGEIEAVPLLSGINLCLIRAICNILTIETPITSTACYPATGDPTERLVDICRQSGASHYLSGPSAKNYLKPELFERAGVVLEYANYAGYLEYPQLHGAFTHTVSVLDLIFNTGPNARKFLKKLV